MSSSISAPNPHFKKMKSKVTFLFLSGVSYPNNALGIGPRFLQIAIDPEEGTAEVYTLARQLQATLHLGEGR
jgi:hypothetical protein